MRSNLGGHVTFAERKQWGCGAEVIAYNSSVETIMFITGADSRGASATLSNSRSENECQS